MRKIISLGLLTLIFSLLSGQALAGKVQYCEDNKQALIEYGLFGLCNAYYNADNEAARAQIEFNYNQKAVPGAPPIRDEAECPCWTSASGRLDLAGDFHSCEVWDGGVSAVFNNPALGYTVVFEFFGSGPACIYDDELGSDVRFVEGTILDACVRNVVDDLIGDDIAACTN